MMTNGQGSTEAGQATGNKYRVFNPDYVLAALENWAVESNLQLLKLIADKSISQTTRAQASRLLAYYDATGITEGLKLNLWAKGKEGAR
jgi:hypothetical protein